MSAPSTPPLDLGLLSSLGFGPDSPLMNEPRVLVDGRFLGAIMVELYDELGSERAQAVFYQIGFFHGFRDGFRLVTQKLDSAASYNGPAGPEATPLAIALGPRRSRASTGAIEIAGAWPEAHEAQTHLGRLGPSSGPTCWLSAGYTAGWLSASFDSEMVVIEQECSAAGHEQCRFVSLEASTCRELGDLPSALLIDPAALDELRVAATRAEAASPPSERGPLDMSEPAVHVWGPVMVLPFTDLEQALRTVEMLGREADTTEVRAVVLDLRSAPLDEAHGAAALEQVLSCIETWGAEPVLTGVAEVSLEMISGLETSRLLIRRDISEAIAIAFQIAEVQRHLL